MQPKISIIIPVYNVEKYLRQCLDSVVNQTMQEIQIICVNDGSPDGSRTILQEYADRDSRVEIIDMPNGGGGPSSARNAGIARIRGKYTYFVDSDDWIDPTLCEKAYCRLEDTNADVMFLFYHVVLEPGHENCWKGTQYSQWATVPLQASNFFAFDCAPWSRVIRTSFFQRLNVRFPEGVFVGEDLYLHWVLLASEPQPGIELLSDKLYYYRLRATSLTGAMGEYMAKDCQVCSLIKDHLRNIGKYEQYRDLLLVRKFTTFLGYYPKLQKNVRADAIRWFRESLDGEEMEFLRTSERLAPHVRDSILCLLGEVSLRWKLRYQISQTIQDTVKMPERLVRRWVVKPLKKWLKTA